MRSAGYDLLGGQDTVFDETADPVVGDTELHSGFGHGEPFAVLLR
jgi:hypothetical protein